MSNTNSPSYTELLILQGQSEENPLLSALLSAYFEQKEEINRLNGIMRVIHTTSDGATWQVL